MSQTATITLSTLHNISEEPINRLAQSPEPTAQQSGESPVPEGGYGWVVAGCCAVLSFWFTGISYSWGVFQASLVSEGVSDVASLSFVGSLTTTCIALFAIMNAKIIRTFGAQKTALLGISLLGGGELLSGFAVHEFGALVVTVGLIMGLGASLCFMTTSTIPSQYFLRKRGLVNGLVYAGGGLGGTVISLSADQLNTRLGSSWTFRIIGIVTLVTGLPAAYFTKERVPAQRRNFVEWRLFRSIRFVGLFVAGTVAVFPLLVPPFFLPLFARSIGLTPSVGAGLVAAFNFSSALGRIGFGLFGDYLGPLNSLILSLILTALSMLTIWPVSGSLAPLVVFAIINGAANGGFFAIIPTVVTSVFGTAKAAVIMSMVVTGWVGGYLMGGPIAGYLLQGYGGGDGGIAAYRPAMYYAGSMSMGAAMIVMFVRLRVNSSFTASI